MPLQWLPLQQSIYDKQRTGAGVPPPRAPISEALTPRARGAVSMGGMPAGEGFMERERRLQEEEDKRKHELKLMDKQIEITKLQAGLREDEAKGIPQITAGQALGREPAPEAPITPELTKENMPEAAETMWKFILDLDEAGQKFFIQQLKEKELGKGYVETAGERVEMPGSVGMYAHLVDRGLIDPATDTVIKKERLFEKGTFTIEETAEDVYKLNTATGRVITLAGKTPEELTPKIIMEIKGDAATIANKTGEKVEDVEYDMYKDIGIDDETSTKLSKFETRPKNAEERGAWDKFTNWIKSVTQREVGKELPKGWAPKGAGRVAFNEANVSSLVPVISDDVTEAERAHLKGQGASDADINEAMRRKAGE